MPRYPFFLAVSIAAFAFVIVTGAVLALPDLKPYGIWLATMSCCITAAIFAFVWPALSWRWGIWLSAGFWLYFGFVFLAYSLNGRLEWLPAIQTLAVLVPACVAALAGQRLSRLVITKNIDPRRGNE